MILKNVSHFGDHCFKEFSSSWAWFIMLLFVSLPRNIHITQGHKDILKYFFKDYYFRFLLSGL